MIHRKKVNVMDISKQVSIEPVLAEAIAQMFDWSNRHGIKGKRLSNLKFDKNADGRISVSCMEIHEDVD